MNSLLYYPYNPLSVPTAGSGAGVCGGRSVGQAKEEI